MRYVVTEAIMKPSIQLYGGVHNDPGSRQKFIEELAKQKTLPHFVAVEWEESIFQRVAAWRPWLTERLRERWNFLTRADCDDLSCALGWEGDASTTLPRFSGIERVWFGPWVSGGMPHGSQPPGELSERRRLYLASKVR
jgi:hypothetical protein